MSLDLHICGDVSNDYNVHSLPTENDSIDKDDLVHIDGSTCNDLSTYHSTHSQSSDDDMPFSVSDDTFSDSESD